MSRDSATRPKRRPGRRLAACALAFLGLAGLGTGSASQFPLAGAAVSAGSAMIDPCQGTTPVRATFRSTFNTSNGRYRANGVTLSGFNAACNTKAYLLRVVTGTTTVGGDLAGVITNGSSELEDFTYTRVDLITSVAVVIL